MIKTTLALSLLAYTIASPAQAQDKCDSVLQYGIWESRESSDTSVDSRQVANFACNASSRSGGGGFSYGGVGVSFSDSSASKSCSSNSSSYFMSTEAKRAVREASQAIVSSWSECMQSVGSHASLLFRDDAHLFTIQLTHQGNKDNVGRSQIVSLDEFSCTQSRERMKSGIQFTRSFSISCSRADIRKPIQIDVSHSDGWGSQTLYIAAFTPSPAALPDRWTPVVDSSSHQIVADYAPEYNWSISAGVKPRDNLCSNTHNGTLVICWPDENPLANVSVGGATAPQGPACLYKNLTNENLKYTIGGNKPGAVYRCNASR